MADAYTPASSICQIPAQKFNVSPQYTRIPFFSRQNFLFSSSWELIIIFIALFRQTIRDQSLSAKWFCFASIFPLLALIPMKKVFFFPVISATVRFFYSVSSMEQDMRYSVWSLINQALTGNLGLASGVAGSQSRKRRYRVSLIIGGGGHGLATAFYLASRYGMTNIAVLEKSWIGSGNIGRNTTIVRSNYLLGGNQRFYGESPELLGELRSRRSIIMQ